MITTTSIVFVLFVTCLCDESVEHVYHDTLHYVSALSMKSIEACEGSEKALRRGMDVSSGLSDLNEPHLWALEQSLSMLRHLVNTVCQEQSAMHYASLLSIESMRSKNHFSPTYSSH